MNPFKDVLKGYDYKFTQNLSKTYFHCTKPHVSVARYRLQNFYKLPCRNTICGFKCWQIFRVFFFYGETIIISSGLIFAFAKFALLISNVLMVMKEESFNKPCSLQPIKKQVFKTETTLIKEYFKIQVGLFSRIRK